MRPKFGFLLLFVTCIVIVSTEMVCTDCYGSKDEFLCHGQGCDAFLWPRDKPLPSNLECKIGNDEQNDLCYVLAGLDPTKLYNKFIALNRFNSHKKDSITFTFQQQPQKMFITADYQNAKYIGELFTHPGISFSDVQESLNKKEFKIVERGEESMRLKVGFYTMVFKNKLIMTINELKDGLNELQSKVSQQILNAESDRGSGKMADRMKKVELQNIELKNQLAKVTKRLNDLQSTKASQTQVQTLSKQSSSFNTKLRQAERANNELRTRLNEIFKKSQDSIKNLSETSGKIAAVQQRVGNHDMTISMLRRTLGTVDRKFAQVGKGFKQQKIIAQKIYQILIQMASTIEVTELEALISASIEIQHSSITQTEELTEQDSQNSDSQFSLKQYLFADVSSHSHVLTTNEELLTIKNLFSSKKIQKMEQLYRASQHDFSTAMFHKHCDMIPDTLVIVETEFGKKIGGFTPLLWDGTKNGEYKEDQTGESFIFSLAKGDKFTLNEKNRAILNHISYGPVFGSGADFSICDEANQKGLSYSNINKSYQNTNYRQGDGQSMQRFCGNPNGSEHFRVKEWEVWRLVFEVDQMGSDGQSA